MSELQDALKRWDSDRSEHVINRIRSESDDVALFVDAARRVANLDIEAAATLIVERIGLPTVRYADPMLVARSYAIRIVNAALGITTEDTK